MKWGEPTDGLSFLEVSGGGVYSTMKATEKGEGVAVRLFALDEETTSTLKFAKPVTYASLCDLKEDEIEELPIENGCVTVKLTPWKIGTVKVRF